MRRIALFVAIGILTVFAAPFDSEPSAAQDGIPTLSLDVYGTTGADGPVFVPIVITIPQVPIILNITFINNDTQPLNFHTFTIDNEDRSSRGLVDSGFIRPGNRSFLEFTVNSMTNVTNGAVSFTPEASARGIRFYCIPHRIDVGGQAAGMIGEIVLAGAPTGGDEGPADKGVLIRAYWIGMIGIAAMIGWIGVSYFVIKSSTPKFRDHRDHMRKGLP